MKLRNYSSTDIGGRSENQDCHATLELNYGYLVIVCDGMGGVKGGKIASELAIKTIIDKMTNSGEKDAISSLLSAIRKANAEIYSHSINSPDLNGMGTTLAALLITETAAVTFHVGDSRIYQIRNGKLIFRTYDHSKVFELVKRGIISEEQARLSEDSNIILRALGINPDVEIEQHDNIPFETHDRFMLCTDGISGSLPEKQLILMLKQKKPLKDIVHEIINHIKEDYAKRIENLDNMTIAIIDTQFNSNLKSKISMKTRILFISLFVLLIISIILNILQYKGLIASHKVNAELIKKDTLFNNHINEITDKQKISPKIDSINQGMKPSFKVNKDLKIEIDTNKIDKLRK